jgi:hypothetical protein
MADFILILYLVIISILLLKSYKIVVEHKQRIFFYVAFALSIFLFVVLAICTVKFDSVETTNLFYYFLLLDSLFFVLIILLIRKIWETHILYILLFVPMAVFFSSRLTDLNQPVYQGAMDGFAAMAKLVDTVLTLFIIYPLFIFLYKMLDINKIIKSSLIIITAIVSFVRGIPLSIGKDGYLSDATGKFFLFLCIWLVLIGLYPFLRKILLNKNLRKSAFYQRYLRAKKK